MQVVAIDPDTVLAVKQESQFSESGPTFTINAHFTNESPKPDMAP